MSNLSKECLLVVISRSQWIKDMKAWALPNKVVYMLIPIKKESIPPPLRPALDYWPQQQISTQLT